VHAEHYTISAQQHTLVERLLREKISLHGICRAVGVGLKWHMHSMVECFAACPDHLQAQLPRGPTDVVMQRLEAEADELWSFVAKKANNQWLWTAMGAKTRQIVALHVGDRSRQREAVVGEHSCGLLRAGQIFHRSI
jgi:hypothetical protein